ncbi:MAG: hypothetical protein HZB38_08195 [Planctomycetes bacterium]|nr:hypothetical protein [Planctomycetota bacterium]
MYAFWHNARPPKPPTAARCAGLLVLIVLGHAVTTFGTSVGYLIGIPIDLPRVTRYIYLLHASEPAANHLKNPLMDGLVMIVIGVVAFLIWRISRLRQPIAVSPEWFVRSWAWSTLLGVFLTPALLGLAWWVVGHPLVAVPFLLLYAVAAPAALAPRVLPTAQRWRPVCPECGHSAAFAVEPRCTECGEPFPCADRFYRRWAIPRLPWERRRRSMLVAYFQTLFFILFRPGQAAWRLANPDRFGRATIWFVGHVAVLIAVISFAGWLATVFGENPNEQILKIGITPVSTRVRWDVLATAEWGAVWALAAVVIPVMLGLGVARALPAITPDTRSGIIKWTLYSSVIPMLATGLLLCRALWRTFQGPSFLLPKWSVTERALVSMTANFNPVSIPLNPSQCLGTVVILFAAWWAIGVANQPRSLVLLVGLLRLIPMLFDLRGFSELL